jgi:tRNA(adenine34) deaminase
LEDVFFMLNALDEAKKALMDGEIPVGAVIVRNGAIIGQGRNERASKSLPLAHAEINAIMEAADALGSWRLDDCTLYVTLEPCLMCSGAILETRIPRVVYGAPDPKAGAAGSLYNVLRDPRMPHRCSVVKGVLAVECSALLKSFFLKKRISNSRPGESST